MSGPEPGKLRALKATRSRSIGARLLLGGVPASWPALRLRPVFYLQPVEAGEVPDIGGDQNEPVDVGDRRNLSIDVRRRTASGIEPGTLLAVPSRRGFVVRKNWKGRVDDLPDVRIQGRAASASGQPADTIGQFVPDGCRDRAFSLAPVQPLEDFRMGRLRYRQRDDARVQKVCDAQKPTSRPVSFARSDRTNASSRPTSSREYLATKSR